MKKFEDSDYDEGFIPKDIIVRPAHEGDLDRMVEILQQFNNAVTTRPRLVRSWLKNELKGLFVALTPFKVSEEGKCVTGIAGFSHTPPLSRQATIYIDMNHQSMCEAVEGLIRGAALIRMAKDEDNSVDDNMIFNIPKDDQTSSAVAEDMEACPTGAYTGTIFEITVQPFFMDGLRHREKKFQAKGKFTPD